VTTAAAVMTGCENDPRYMRWVSGPGPAPGKIFRRPPIRQTAVGVGPSFACGLDGVADPMAAAHSSVDRW
jgi:hypothetical protein